MDMSKPIFPPNVPEKLIVVFFECKSNYSKTAKCLGIHKTHVWNLIKHGKEPVDPAIRQKLFLTAKKHPKPPAWVTQAADWLAEREQPETLKRVYDRLGREMK